MTGDFNIRDSLWDTLFSHHSSISNNLLIIADSFNLTLSSPTNPCPTRYSDIEEVFNSVIDLMFLWYRLDKTDYYLIHLEWCLTLDHTPLTISVPIIDKVVNISRLLIQQNSKQEVVFVEEITSIFKNLDTSSISDKPHLENTVNCLNVLIDQAWNKHAKWSRIMKHSKQWWNEDYSKSLNKYKTTKSLENWKRFKKVVKNSKRSFFDLKIQEVTNKSHKLWELIN